MPPGIGAPNISIQFTCIQKTEIENTKEINYTREPRPDHYRMLPDQIATNNKSRNGNSPYKVKLVHLVRQAGCTARRRVSGKLVIKYGQGSLSPAA